MNAMCAPRPGEAGEVVGNVKAEKDNNNRQSRESMGDAKSRGDGISFAGCRYFIVGAKDEHGDSRPRDDPDANVRDGVARHVDKDADENKNSRRSNSEDRDPLGAELSNCWCLDLGKT